MKITRETIAYATEAEWLAHRAKDVTSTETSALFAASPYCTNYELYHRKTGALPIDDFVENTRMKWGTRLESAIAYGVAEDLGLVVEPFKTYARIPEIRLGSSFDFKIVGLVDSFSGDEAARDMFRQHGPGIMEIKNVDGLQFKRGWTTEESHVEAPPHIEFQVQTQLEVSGLEWSVIAPLVGGNTPVPFLRVRDHEVGAAIRLKVAEFWTFVTSGTPPAPDFTKDGSTIARLHLDNDGSSIDLSDNAHLAALCLAYKAAAADAKSADERKSAAKAEILTIVQAAKSIAADGFKISAGTNKESYRCYTRAASERITISVAQIKACDIEATVAPFRNVRISEV